MLSLLEMKTKCIGYLKKKSGFFFSNQWVIIWSMFDTKENKGTIPLQS